MSKGKDKVLRKLKVNAFYSHQLGGAIAVLSKVKRMNGSSAMICETNGGVIDSRGEEDVYQFTEIDKEEFEAMMKKPNTVNR